MVTKKTQEQKLKEENKTLKRALAVCLNEPLMKQINGALKRMNEGRYVSETDFLKITA